ncbi:hypothetical protein ABAC460_14945 [Asticcacaulis sp. AC460]|uniref:hypothetical protein n=1 Tax=Asticcacaulis sp. AC460 TaxID=1282360 RepID=UPI0003C3D2C2|nr:hypothetical protein [Asticcacaulis sp. AC460]ESQ88745.1 hypothetical protein ABAC460_14945 [Asticcacaulis sp. AC460]
MLNRRHLLASVAALAAAPSVRAATGLKVTRFIDDTSVELSEGATRQTVRRGETFAAWTLVEILPDQVVLETFRIDGGDIAFVDTTGLRMAFGKTAESTEVDFSKAFLGHTEAEVRESPTDLLGQQILSRPGDPDYDTVASAFPPIRKVWGDTYNFLGTPENQDKVWFMYGGRSPNFDPAVYQPSVDAVRKAGKVRDGLVGGYLPCLRFVYPEDNGDWTEMLAFAPLRMINGNTRMQPVWYRVSRIEEGRLAWSRHIDSYLPYPPREGDDPKLFYADLLAFKAGWDEKLAAGMQVDLPDARLQNQARHSLIRAMMGRSDGYPKYGTVDKNYGGSEHDGFPDTFNVETAAMIEWGLIERAGVYIDNYFGKFVRDDGVILYRGPETGQFGRMLTVVAQYITHGGDPDLLLRHRKRIDAITHVLLGMRAKALTLAKDDPAYGMLSGWSEADAVLEADPQRYMQPYFSNSTEAIRGFTEIGDVWRTIATARADSALYDWGQTLISDGQHLARDLQTAMSRSMLTVDGETILPTIAGAKEPFHVVLQRDRSDPQWRSYRSWMEMLYSGFLWEEEINRIIDYRGRHHDIVLGMPMAYGYRTGEMAGFLSYGHGYGLIQNDRIREALLMTYSSMAHQYTRGAWLAPETRRPLADDFTSAYCSPSQLVCPLMARWLLVYEERWILWLGKGLPQAWLEPGKTVRVTNAPTRWGRTGYAISSSTKRIEATIALPPIDIRDAPVRMRLRFRGRIDAVTINGKRSEGFDPETGDIFLSSEDGRDVRIVANITRI